eukprot:6581235-Prymnesium_polylepis.1
MIPCDFERRRSKRGEVDLTVFRLSARRSSSSCFYYFNLLLEHWPTPLLAAPSPRVMSPLPLSPASATSAWSLRVASIQHARPIQLSIAGRVAVLSVNRE